jgi:hypothetical protein
MSAGRTAGTILVAATPIKAAIAFLAARVVVGDADRATEHRDATCWTTNTGEKSRAKTSEKLLVQIFHTGIELIWAAGTVTQPSPPCGFGLPGR